LVKLNCTNLKYPPEFKPTCLCFLLLYCKCCYKI